MGPKTPKNSKKTMPKSTSIFYRFLVDFGLQFGSPGRAHEPTFWHPFFHYFDPRIGFLTQNDKAKNDEKSRKKMEF